MKRHNCQARQYSDQMICAPCGLTWDTNARDGLKGQIAGMQAAYRLFLDRAEL